MEARQLSEQLRNEHSDFLRNRRVLVGLSLAAGGCMQVVGLYQMGILRHLPEPPLRGLNADRIDASEEAYAKLSAPDAIIGLVSYSVTALLASMGEADRARTRPWLPLAMGAKIALDSAQAGKLSWDQWAKHRAFCSWCLLAAGATFSMIPWAVPETRAALRRIWQVATRPGPIRSSKQDQDITLGVLR